MSASAHQYQNLYLQSSFLHIHAFNAHTFMQVSQSISQVRLTMGGMSLCATWCTSRPQLAAMVPMAWMWARGMGLFSRGGSTTGRSSRDRSLRIWHRPKRARSRASSS